MKQPSETPSTHSRGPRTSNGPQLWFRGTGRSGGLPCEQLEYKTAVGTLRLTTQAASEFGLRYCVALSVKTTRRFNYRYRKSLPKMTEDEIKAAAREFFEDIHARNPPEFLVIAAYRAGDAAFFKKYLDGIKKPLFDSIDSAILFHWGPGRVYLDDLPLPPLRALNPKDAVWFLDTYYEEKISHADYTKRRQRLGLLPSPVSLKISELSLWRRELRKATGQNAPKFVQRQARKLK